MRFSLLAHLFAVVVLASTSLAQGGRPIPPGEHQAGKAVAQGETEIPPPLNQRPHLDVAKVKGEADQLAALAQSIPPDIEQTTKGMLPKDLAEKLKKIEKLARQLRNQITP